MSTSEFSGKISASFEQAGFHFVEKSVSELYDDELFVLTMNSCCEECDREPCQLGLSEKLDQVMMQLFAEGIPPEMVREWLDSHVILSRLTITSQNKIFLDDFENMEIEMGPLPKTIFLFYLKHPEGVDFFYLQDYSQELMEIYGHLTACDDPEKIKDRIRRLTDPFDNGINEKCSAIKKAFTDKLDDSVARFYYVWGHQGCRKKILLDRSLVRWA